MSRNALLSALALLTVACQSDTQPGPVGAAPEISASEIREHTRILSSDEFFGRGPGHLGGRMAAEYIAEAFEEYGLEAPGGSYVQPVPIIGTTPEPPTARKLKKR